MIKRTKGHSRTEKHYVRNKKIQWMSLKVKDGNNWGRARELEGRTIVIIQWKEQRKSKENKQII